MLCPFSYACKIRKRKKMSVKARSIRVFRYRIRFSGAWFSCRKILFSGKRNFQLHLRRLSFTQSSSLSYIRYHWRRLHLVVRLDYFPRRSNGWPINNEVVFHPQTPSWSEKNSVDFLNVENEYQSQCQTFSSARAELQSLRTRRKWLSREWEWSTHGYDTIKYKRNLRDVDLCFSADK